MRLRIIFIILFLLVGLNSIYAKKVPMEGFEKPDGPGDPKNWTFSEQAESAKRVQANSSRGKYSLELKFKNISSEKSTFNMAYSSDWRKMEKIYFDIYNPTGKRLSLILAISTGGWIWHEARSIFISPGWNKNVFINLDKPTFKAAPDWEFKYYLKRKDKIERLTFEISSAGGKLESGSIFIDNMKLKEGKGISEDVLLAEYKRSKQTGKPIHLVSIDKLKYKKPVIKDIKPNSQSPGQYNKFEAKFSIKAYYINPFNPREIDIMAKFISPSGKKYSVPCFVDAGTETLKKIKDYSKLNIWMARFAPMEIGKWKWHIIAKNPAGESKTQEQSFECGAGKKKGFIRLSKEHLQQFVFDNKEPYYPMGNNLCCGPPDHYGEYFEAMNKAGENWSRLWVTHMGEMNIDWTKDKKEFVPLGTLDFKTVRQWDEIVNLAEKYGIYFQMTLQHFGQYSTKVNPKWHENPWNEYNGGFLKKSEEFFSDMISEKLTKNKYRYMIARWGYSTSIMAWEFFNEVQFTDAYDSDAGKLSIIQWHNEMADYIRSLDTHNHLVTTSSVLELDMWKKMDYYQPHLYAKDMVAAANEFIEFKKEEFDKPIFYGEIGPHGMDLEDKKDEFIYTRSMTWSGLMSDSAGMAQQWDGKKIYEYGNEKLFSPITGFAKLAKLGYKPYKRIPVRIQSKMAENLEFGPGQGWAKAENKEFLIPEEIHKAGEIAEYLHCSPDKRKAGFPGSITFHIETKKECTFIVTVNKVSAWNGSRIAISVDSKLKAAQEWSKEDSNRDMKDKVKVTVPPGKHTIKIESTGQDWFSISSFKFINFGMSVINGYARSTGDSAFLWIYNRDGIHSPGAAAAPEKGKISFKMNKGNYTVKWWDTEKAKVTKEEKIQTDDNGMISLDTPPIARDIAVYIE